ncbi:MAG: nicotinate-nucleotide adenylyltransferase [Candidatus Thiodiazotropha sp.]|jgi:nicotinate-nucleotide adenylyltransferase
MIGIFGGTFDPIHYGHLRSALDVMQMVDLEEVRFIPLHAAVHRDQPQAPAQLRMQMVEAAIAEQSGFVADDRELQRAGYSYSVDTLTELRQLFPEKPLCLMMGLDAFNGFPNWHRPDEILRLAHLIVMQRPGEAEPSIGSKQYLSKRQCHEVSEVKQRQAGTILLQTFTQLDISSTQIRTLLAQGLLPRYLLPEAVLDIIQAHGLYNIS